MNKIWVKAGLVVGCIMFIWNAVSWMVLPWHKMTMKAFSHEQVVSFVMKQNAKESGVYFYPSDKEKMKDGPLIFASVCHEGFDFKNGLPMLYALIAYFVLGFIGSYIVSLVRHQTYGKKVFLFFLFGCLAGFSSPVSNMIWWKFSMAFTLPVIVDFLVSWTLGGLIAARMIRS